MQELFLILALIAGFNVAGVLSHGYGIARPHAFVPEFVGPSHPVVLVANPVVHIAIPAHNVFVP